MDWAWVCRQNVRMLKPFAKKAIIKLIGHKGLNISQHGCEVGKMRLQLDSQKQWTKIRRAYQIYECTYVHINVRCTSITLHFHHLIATQLKKKNRQLDWHYWRYPIQNWSAALWHKWWIFLGWEKKNNNNNKTNGIRVKPYPPSVPKTNTIGCAERTKALVLSTHLDQQNNLNVEMFYAFKMLYFFFLSLSPFSRTNCVARIAVFN